MLKDVKWLGKSRKAVKGFIKTVRAQIGYQLYRVQQGLMPTDYKPMASVGKGALEIRLHRPHEHRVIYVAKLKNKVYILHAFEKKTQKTCPRDVETAKRNYQELMNRINNVKIKE